MSYVRKDAEMKRRRATARGLAYALITADLTEDFDAAARLIDSAGHEELQDACRYLTILLGGLMVNTANGSRAAALFAHRRSVEMEEAEIQRGGLDE